MDKGLSVLSGLALLALVKRNGVGSLTSSRTSKKTNKRYGYRLVFSITKANFNSQRKNIVFYEKKTPDYPIALTIPEGLSTFSKEVELDITNMYIHKVEKEHDGEGYFWLNRFYFVVEAYSDFIVISMNDVGEELRDGVLYEEHGDEWIRKKIVGLFTTYFSIGIGPMVSNPEMRYWDMQCYEYAYDEAKKDPRWDQELQDKHDKILSLDLEEFFDDSFNIDTSQNDNIRKEYEEQFHELYGHDKPREQIIKREYPSLVLNEYRSFDLLTDRFLAGREGIKLFTPKVRNISSRVNDTDDNGLTIIYPFTVQKVSKLRKR
jgi:hypothetical protein